MTVEATAVQAKAVAGAEAKMKGAIGRPLKWYKQLLYQVLCLFVAFTVLFPIAWVVSQSISTSKRITGFLPEGAITFEAYQKVLDKPTTNPVSFLDLTFNSFKLAAGASFASVLLGVSAAYAFSRFKFPGRGFVFLAILAVLMLPSVATIAPLFAFMNRIQVGEFNLRNSLWGVGLAITSGLLPFATWNLKGFLDTIPKDLEEAGMIDGANRNQIFFQIILPLSTPALAVTALFGFIGGWTEFYFSWQFLTNPKDFTLAMALSQMSGQYARSTPWDQFCAFALLVALPVSVVYLALQRYIVSGLTAGGVKG
ncbi:ABC transporter permease subunit [Candidatus Chlorohelix sp.]|uniref:sugar ABC transporter permease n=1 Tax=Candidatus Chlorohelix sp. TaxID=3139201 RepID=UPI003045211E